MRCFINFNLSPFIAIWEITQACDLACVHCRASAQPNPLPGELSDAEGFRLIEQVAELGTRVMVLSGGDPLKRKALPEFIRHGKSLGLRMGTIPAASPSLCCEQLVQLKEAGVDQVAFSLDSSSPEGHDRFRQVPGAFAKTLQAVQWAHELDLPVQINSVMTQHNFDEVDALINLVSGLDVVFWEVFFLVPVGRGAEIEGLTADQCEAVFAKLYPVAAQKRFIVKVTEGPHFRRYYLQQQNPGINPLLHQPMGPQGSIGRAPQGVNAGKGYVFISHQGEVFPSGFLPVSVGNVRECELTKLYRESPLFQLLRNTRGLKGRCGICEYREICGGSRARSYALTGDALAEDPWCNYQPAP